MQTLTQYKSKVKNLFFDYLQGAISAKELKIELKLVEQYHRDLIQDKNSDKRLQFKFDEVNGLLTIDNIINFLSEKVGMVLMEFAIHESLKLDNDLEIYFS